MTYKCKPMPILEAKDNSSGAGTQEDEVTSIVSQEDAKIDTIMDAMANVQEMENTLFQIELTISEHDKLHKETSTKYD